MASQKQRRPKTERVAAESAQFVDERTARLRELVPEAFSEGRVDFEKLQAALGDLVDDRPERYSFSWAGKRDAIRLLQTPSRATLLPCPEESVNWDSTEHLFVEGDNLEVLKLLYKSYAGRVKMIYIDPPYNTGQDFIYPDDFADPLHTYLRLTAQTDEAGNLLTSNPETSGRYHSAWLSTRQVRIPFADTQRSYTRSFERYLLELRQRMTILDVAAHLSVSWWLVKDVEQRYLKRKFARPKLRELTQIAIDEIAIGRGGFRSPDSRRTSRTAERSTCVERDATIRCRRVRGK